MLYYFTTLSLYHYLQFLFEYFFDSSQRVNKFIQLFFCIIDGQRRARGGRHTEMLHHGLCTMMAGSNGNTVLVDESSDVMSMHSG